MSSILDLLSDTDETYFIRHVGNRKLIGQKDESKTKS